MSLIQKYISGHCTPEEVEKLKNFLETPEGKKEWEQTVVELWDVRGVATPLTERKAKAMLKTVLFKAKAHTILPVSKEITFPRRSLYYAAASVLLMVTAAFFFNVQKVKWQEQSTFFGEQKRIELPDGSSVILNGNSTIRFAASWATTARESWLQGEAFFDVRHIKGNQRFTVHLADKSQINVLGTAFNVHQGIGGSEVVLQRGKIEWHANGQKTLVMIPGDKLSYSKAKQIVLEKHVRPEQYSSWTNGFIMLDGLTLKEVTIHLQDVYGWTFHFENEALAAQTLWGSLPMDDPKLILRSLAQVTRTHIKEHNHNVTISSY